jgi:glutathione S-transferase
MSIKIYSCNDSRGVRPMWTAEEMGLSYETEMMPFPPRFLHKEYMDINILGTIPYLIDGEVEMTESVAMCQYLVEKYGPTNLRVNSDEADYHHYLNWLAHSDATLTFPQTVVLRYTLQEIGVADTIADICVSYAIYLAKSLQIEEAFKPNIKRWTDMLFERDGFKRATSIRYSETQ